MSSSGLTLQSDGSLLLFRATDICRVPDGLTVDHEGCLWSARWGGSAVHRYSPAGEWLSKNRPPGPESQCAPTFGGRDLHTLFVTTARGASQGPSIDGGSFSTRVGVQGRLEFFSRARFRAKASVDALTGLNHLGACIAIRGHAVAAWLRDLNEGESSDKFRLRLQQPFDRLKFLIDAFRVVDAVDADADA